MRRLTGRSARCLTVSAAAVLVPSTVVGGSPATGAGLRAAAYVDVVSGATGGSAIPSTTAHIGGTGAWTQLHGPVLREAVLGDWTVGMVIHLFLPDNAEWDPVRTVAPAVNACRLGARPVDYPTERTAKVTLTFHLGGPASTPCRIDFGSILQVRPIQNRESRDAAPGCRRDRPDPGPVRAARGRVGVPGAGGGRRAGTGRRAAAHAPAGDGRRRDPVDHGPDRR